MSELLSYSVLQPIKGLRDTVIDPLAITPFRSSLGNTIFCILQFVNRLTRCMVWRCPQRNLLNLMKGIATNLNLRVSLLKVLRNIHLSD